MRTPQPIGISLGILLAVSSAMGQTVTGSITGLVTDPSGALVSGANVTAENVATGVKTTATDQWSGCVHRSVSAHR